VKRTFTLLAVAAIAVAGGIAFLLHSSAVQDQAGAHRVVHLGVLPSAGKAHQQARYAPFLTYLARETGWEFQLSVASSYEELVELFRQGKVDLVNFGGFTFVKAHALYNAVPLVMRDTDYRATTSFVVKGGTPLASCCELDCKELVGKKALLGPELSTSGHLMPLYFLKTKKGIDPKTFFGDVRHSTGHTDTAKRIHDGDADVGMIYSPTFRAMLQTGELKKDDLTVIWETPPYPDNVWAIQKSINEDAKTRVRDAFLALDYTQADHRSILDALGATSFFPAGESDFRQLQEIALSLGLMATEKSE